MKTKFLKRNNGPRKHTVKTVNLLPYHEEIIKRKRINFSALTRELLNDYFRKEFPELFEALKQDFENEENEREAE